MRLGLALTVLFFPALVYGAGFAPQSVFLSKSPVTEGDTVRIYAIVSNSAQEKFSGQVVLSESGSEIGAVAVVLAAGATQTASALWVPSAGNHTVVAELKADDGTVVERRTATFNVQEKPVPATDADAEPAGGSVEPSHVIQQTITNISPAVGSAATPVFNVIDSVRQKIADVADKQLASTKPKLGGAPLSGAVEGAQTGKPPATLDWLWSIVYTLYYYVLTIIRFIVGSAGIFYPLLAVAFLYVLWRMFRRYRRPAY